MSEALHYSHAGWEAYYLHHRDERAWGGVPDAFLMEHIDDVLVDGASIILDAASGDGRNAVPFLEKGLTVLSADLSPTALSTFANRCRLSGGRKPCLVAGDFLSMGLVHEQFDAVICLNSIPHFESPSQVLHKIAELLRAGGRAVFNAFTPGDVAFGQGEKIGENIYYYLETLFTFMTEEKIEAILPSCLSIIHAETRKWEEPDHGNYRRGSHIHEAYYFITEKKATKID